MRLFRKKKHVSLYQQAVTLNLPVRKTLFKKLMSSPIYRLIFFGALLLILLLWLGIIIRDNNIYPIKHVKIIAEFKHLDPKILQNTIIPYTKTGFFHFNAVSLRKELLSLPWVNNASIQRIWPDKVVVSIDEQIPIAKWNNLALLNAGGELFKPEKNTFPSDLPELFGPENEIKNILQNYFAMSQMLKPLRFSIRQLTVDRRLAWHLILNNDLDIFLGQKNIQQRFELFIKAYPRIIAGNPTKKAKSFDLRYDNGLAVKWEAFANPMTLK